MSTLYELTGDYLRLLELGEDPETDPEVFKDTLEGLDGEIEIKAEGYAKVIKQLEADAKMLGDEAKRLTDRKKSAENNIAAMKKSLEEAMKATGKTKFKTELFSFGIQKNPPSVKVDEEHLELIPIEYLVPQDPKIDKKRILEELKGGATFTWATMEQGESLRIR
ncbi:MAG: siphovirus Gp157 family protein [Clostridia bacterium]|nr:siphovirus Gp157 family protein [Clostridia bacterium]